MPHRCDVVKLACLLPVPRSRSVTMRSVDGADASVQAAAGVYDDDAAAAPDRRATADGGCSI